MADRERLICASEALLDGGDGVRFEVFTGSETVPAFAVRFAGRVYAYLNRCGHVPMQLDWLPGRFFDLDARLLICSTHGALYDPRSGRCRGGPCRGAGLTPVEVVERDGGVWLRENDPERR